MTSEPLQLLEKHWGYRSFRPMQQTIIESVLSGRDVFAMLPTGGGKSLCYQLPAVAKPGLTLVVSPLVALMQDQVDQLIARQIPAAFLHAGLTAAQTRAILDNAENGSLKLLYIAPERLQSKLFLAYTPHLRLNLIAVDEAHCISQWGYDFRPAYLQIKNLRTDYPRIPVMALTASATTRVREDIINQLNLTNPLTIRQTVVRDNLFYNVRYTENKYETLLQISNAVKGSAIIYCGSRKRCEETALFLRQNGLNATAYHAGMHKAMRQARQQEWTSSPNQIMCATTAFGMGIDKADVRLVAHWDIPDQLESYYQEAGRAGRDGNKACSVLLYHHNDLDALRKSIDIRFPEPAYIQKVYHSVGDFLQIGINEGAETLYDFDIRHFCHNFQLRLRETLNAIKILAREGYWEWSEQTQVHAGVMLTTNRSTLQYLEKNQPVLHYITTGLLRLHPGIFHFPATLKIWDTAKLLRMEQQPLLKGLQKLADLGVIDYRPARSGPSLFWLTNRVAPRHFQLNKKLLHRLRENAWQRIRSMIYFVENDRDCRNILLARYFGEETLPAACGGCDVCRQKPSGKRQHKDTGRKIHAFLQNHQQIDMQTLTSHFPDVPRNDLLEFVRRLCDEGICTIQPNGTIEHHD